MSPLSNQETLPHHPSAQILNAGRAPEISGVETALKYSYATLAVFGAQHPRAGVSAHADHPGTLRLLLERGAPASVPDLVGYTPLHLACMTPVRADLARILLEHGADPNARDRFGSVPLMGALQAGTLDAIEALLAHGADLDVADADGVTPEEFYPRCGPEVGALVQRWRRRRAGEEQGALEEKACAWCGKSEGLKFCKSCHAIRYCSKDCQSEWFIFTPPRMMRLSCRTDPMQQNTGPIIR